jgi:hypothetical protein
MNNFIAGFMLGATFTTSLYFFNRRSLANIAAIFAIWTGCYLLVIAAR